MLVDGGRGWGMWKCLSGPTLRPLPPPTFAAPKADPIFSTHPTSHFYTLAVECPSARLTSLFCFSPGFHYRFEGRRQYRHAPEFTLRPPPNAPRPPSRAEICAKYADDGSKWQGKTKNK